MHSTLWAFNALPPEQILIGEKVLRQIYCDFAMLGLAEVEADYASESIQIKNAIDIARRFALGTATDLELTVAHDTYTPVIYELDRTIYDTARTDTRAALVASVMALVSTCSAQNYLSFIHQPSNTKHQLEIVFRYLVSRHSA